uniref:Voltage-dependent calcium channel gamma-1 subunit n=1 Tax=Eptatretus burgeri TaxID=7764 RepID=A0A8C4WVU0_EPTBU
MLSKRTKIHMTAIIAFAGLILAVVAISTDFWAILEPSDRSMNGSCDAAHLGLWRLCRQTGERSWDVTGCRNMDKVVTEFNCSFFKHFTAEEGEDFELEIQKEYGISAAVIAILSLVLIILGAVCLLIGVRKKQDYMMRPAGLFLLCAGLSVIISMEVIRQSVKNMIQSEKTIWHNYYYSWSFACSIASAIILFISGIALVLLSLPRMPQKPWETCLDAEPEPQY